MALCSPLEEERESLVESLIETPARETGNHEDSEVGRLEKLLCRRLLCTPGTKASTVD